MPERERERMCVNVRVRSSERKSRCVRVYIIERENVCKRERERMCVKESESALVYKRDSVSIRESVRVSSKV